MEAVTIKYIIANKDKLEDKTLFVDLLNKLNIVESDKTYKILDCFKISLDTPLNNEIFEKAENKFVYSKKIDIDYDKEINHYKNLKKICLEFEMFKLKEKLKTVYENQNLKDDQEEETIYCDFCNGLFKTKQHSDEKYMFYNRMDKNNQKASNILFSEGSDKAIEFMFKHPDTGQKMDYSTMRYYYG
tara:strand:- start:1518 stop:2078 length:561 start_codon:yes stop_codon:yes gene_type:complete